MTTRIALVLAMAALLLADTGWGSRIPTSLAAQTTPTPKAGVGQQSKRAAATATAQPESTTGGATGDLLDLAAIAPVPADAAETGYGVRSGIGYGTLDAFAATLNAQMGGGVDDVTSVAADLKEAGWLQSYYQSLDIPSDDDPDIVWRSLYTSFIQYADADGAEAGLSLVAEAYATMGYEPTRTTPEIGDRAVQNRGNWTASGTGKPYQELSLLFRADDLVIELAILDYTNDAPATSEAATLAERILERVAAARAGEAPNLSQQALRLQGAGLYVYWDTYRVQGGDVVAYYKQTTSQMRSDESFFADNKIVDNYWYYTEWTDPEANPDQATPVVYSLTIYRFASEDGAAAWVADQPQSWVDSPATGYHDVEILDGEPQWGDGSAVTAFEFDRSSGDSAKGYFAWLSVGDRVAFIELQAVPEADLATLEALAADQATCLEEDACAARAEAPALFGA